MAESERLPDAGPWLVEGFRFTFFLQKTSEKVPGDEWWVNLFGSQAPNRQTDANGAIVQEQGFLEGLVVTLVRTAGRVDFFFGAQPGESKDLPFNPAPPLKEGIERCKPIIFNWLKLVSNVTRVATGCGLEKKAKDAKQAVEQLYPYLKEVQFKAAPKELLLHLNRPRTSSINESIVINRVSVWSVVRFAMQGPSPSVASESQGADAVFSRVEIDVNTQAGAPIPQPAQPEMRKLIDELIEMMIEISEKGDEG